jgi:hypothetical protein
LRTDWSRRRRRRDLQPCFTLARYRYDLRRTAPYPLMRQSETIRTACPRNQHPAHVEVRPALSTPFFSEVGYRPLTRAEVQQEIEKLDLSDQGRVRRVADLMSDDLPGDGRDLLHDAVCKALTSRTCKADLTVEKFLSGVMRSLASTKRRSRERGRENHVFMPTDDVAERMGGGSYMVASAEQIIEIERVRTLCAEVLDQLAAVSPIQSALIEAIGLDLRGQNLADHLGITLHDLATVRRGLKRHVQRLWPTIESEISPEEQSEA